MELVSDDKKIMVVAIPENYKSKKKDLLIFHFDLGRGIKVSILIKLLKVDFNNVEQRSIMKIIDVKRMVFIVKLKNKRLIRQNDESLQSSKEVYEVGTSVLVIKTFKDFKVIDMIVCEKDIF